MPLTPNHGYNVPNKGETDWHKPLNQNFKRHDTDIEIRDRAGNRSNYDPKAGAKFLATDTGEVYVGDGSNWNQLKTSGRSPKFDEVNPSNNFLGVGRTSRVSNDEFFGVQATVKSGDFGGMDVNGADPESRPYYGYATDGTEHAYHYYDGADDVWRLNTGNTEKLSASQGFVGVNVATRGAFLGNVAFGIEADTSGTDFGGMFVETSSSDGRAQVAYKTAGSP